jgi:hypothetical protein
MKVRQKKKHSIKWQSKKNKQVSTENPQQKDPN